MDSAQPEFVALHPAPVCGPCVALRERERLGVIERQRERELDAQLERLGSWVERNVVDAEAEVVHSIAEPGHG